MLPEPELAVVRCSEVPSRDFDPMLVEVTVAAGAIKAGASPLPAEPVSPVHRTLDAAEVDPEILSGDRLVALPSSLTTDMSVSHTRAPDSAAPACATVADVADAPATSFVDDFISSISSNLSPPILSSPPRLRVSQVSDYSVVPDDVDDARDDAVPTPPPEVDPGMLFVNSLRLPLPEALVRTPPALPRCTP